MAVNLFDANFYGAANPDLAAAGLTTEAQLLSHFQNAGIDEGRVFSPFANINFYSSSNPDLAAAGLNTNRQLFNHLQNNGVAEGRSFSQFFDVNFYRAANRDLAGLNNEQALRHLQTSGLNEGRSFSQFFDADFYRAANRDLARLNNRQALNHLQINGLDEGRSFSQFFDADFYRAANRDLAGMNNRQALNHLQINGLGEGRSFSQFFDTSQYRSSNPDLVTAYANAVRRRTEQVAADPGLREFLVNHFQLSGLSEGRSFSRFFDVNYYGDVNSDLASAGLSNQQMYEHFQLNGLGEGRQSSYILDVSYYLSSNSDLVAAGFNNSQAYEHFLLSGQREGRRGTEFGSFSTGAEISAAVIDLRNVSDSDGYRLNASLDAGDRANPTRIGSYTDDYRLTGLSVNQRVQLNMNAEFDTYLQLVNASTGEVIDFNDDNGTLTSNSQLRFIVQSGIDYIIRATSYSASAVGNYVLFADSPSSVVGSVTGSQTLRGALSTTDFINPDRSGSYRDDYNLMGVSAGQQVRVNLNASFDTYLQLVNASTGGVINFNDDSNGTQNSELRFTVQSGVNYIIRATSYDSGETGNYTLTTASSGAAITTEQSIAGVLNSTDPLNPLRNGTYRDDYSLTGATVGQQIRLNLNSVNGSFDTYLQLVNASTQALISANDDSNGTQNSELLFTVQSGVSYTIRVTSYGTNSTGAYTLTTTSGGSNTDFFSANIRDAQLQTIARNRAADGTLDRSDMLAILRDAQDSSVIDATELTDLRTLVANSTRLRMPNYVEYLSRRVADNASVNMSASTFESSLVGRWFLGTIAPTARFNNSLNNTTTPLTYTPVQGGLFGSAGRAVIGDIDQGELGDCAFLAALGATFRPQSSDAGNTSSSLINNMITDNGDNTYTIRFFSNGTPEWVTVDRRLATFNGLLYGASANGSRNPNNPSNVLWAPLVERAYAQWREGREGEPGYDLIGNGDVPSRPLGFVTGRTATQFGTGGSAGSFSSISFSQIQAALSSGQAIELGRHTPSHTSFIIGGHAYSLTNAYTNGSGQQRITVRNPWGRDGRTVSGSNDGFIDLSFSEFSSSFHSITFA